MKKLLTLFLCLLLAASLPTAALADLIWEPMDDFYFDHMDECRRIDEEFLAEADTPIYESPQNAAQSGVIRAGETQQITYVWTDSRGIDWGYVEYWKDGMIHGWISLADPGAKPAPATQTLPVVLTVCVLAAAAILILFIKPKKH